MVSEYNKTHFRGHRVILTSNTAAPDRFNTIMFLCPNCLCTKPRSMLTASEMISRPQRAQKSSNLI